MVEKEIVKQFLNKVVVFNKKNDENRSLVGRVKQVTDTVMLIEFKGQLQAHNLNEILNIEEAFNFRGDL